MYTSSVKKNNKIINFKLKDKYGIENWNFNSNFDTVVKSEFNFMTSIKVSNGKVGWEKKKKKNVLWTFWFICGK